MRNDAEDRRRRAARQRRWYADHRDQIREETRLRVWQLKLQMIDAYGGACSCCGEHRPELLTLEHINGVPDHHRLRSGRRMAGGSLYAAVRDEGYPPEYTVLCWNCNAARYHFGECPHERERREGLREAA